MCVRNAPQCGAYIITRAETCELAESFVIFLNASMLVMCEILWFWKCQEEVIIIWVGGMVTNTDTKFMITKILVNKFLMDG